MQLIVSSFRSLGDVSRSKRPAGTETPPYSAYAASGHGELSGVKQKPEYAAGHDDEGSNDKPKRREAVPGPLGQERLFGLGAECRLGAVRHQNFDGRGDLLRGRRTLYAALCTRTSGRTEPAEEFRAKQAPHQPADLRKE